MDRAGRDLRRARTDLMPRYVVKDLPRAVRRHGWSSVLVWWQDTPWRKREAWSVLLFEKGQGWLRWGTSEVYVSGSWNDSAFAYEPGGDVQVAPPLRRLGRFLWGQLEAPFYARRCGESWSVVRPSWRDMAYLRDPERGWAWR